jgi:hypothetical protein
VRIPDDIATRLRSDGRDLSRRAIEAFAAEEYQHGRLTKPELQRLLGIQTSFQLEEHTAEDAELEHKAPTVFEQRLGLFGGPDDAALLDEVVATAYEERRHPA